ncbi:hypothetical protein R3X25_12500 [Lutibacter sp. TH_r2]|uniref:helix-turn-helix transcriptional regulator n=1 Tax=Lutibacter sp. TH_r2 TaxID=3082083 RepID=UPI002954C0DF|nr:hypothetical protein [Lutibacter sp. TH_r2]MDV7188104.1 hypothetical protein [Lutibacter sp. TH_r2]
MFTFFYCAISYSQKNEKVNYEKFIDSAYNNIDNFPKIAVSFLDSIPKPLAKTITGNISDYYHIKAVASNYLNKEAEVYHYNILALNFAEKEKNYTIAGTSSLELFYNLYIVKKDSTAFDYLKKAKKFYTLNNNANGLTEVMQMEAFVEFYNNNYAKSNALILPKLNHYQSIKNDQYYYMYALFMLTSNYTYLNDKENFRKYFNEFKKLETDTTIAPLLYKKHKVTLYNCLAEMYLENKLLDSTIIYIEKANSLREYMNNSDIENYLKNNIAYYTASKNIEAKSNYVDSLKVFQQNIIKETIDASFNINKTLIETNQNLKDETEKNHSNRNWILGLIFILTAFIVFVFIRYKNIRNSLNEFSKRKDEYSFLQNNHDKLKAKVVGLEDYLTELKKEFKRISVVSDPVEQRILVVDFYKKLHGDSSFVINTNENFIEKLSKQNKEFFSSISTKFPKLNVDEKIICYYAYTGFKNKEIAVFLNTTIRAIESKRYRIYKKIDFSNKNESFTEYLDFALKT